jgi:hypothetical protein
MNPHFFGVLLRSAVNAVAPYMKLQMNWLTMMAPHTNERSESLSYAAAASSRDWTTEEELAHSMDVALGARVAPPA